MKKSFLSVVLISLISLISCKNNQKEVKVTQQKQEVKTTVTDPMQDKGIGPVKSVSLDATVNKDMAAEGKVIFEANCKACHRINKRYVGPKLKGVTKKQSPEWIMNMILNPTEMISKNATAKQLIAEYGAPMSNQNLTKEQARKILEYFRSVE